MLQIVPNRPRHSIFQRATPGEYPVGTRRNMPVVLDTRVVTGSGGGPDKTILNSPRYLEPLGYRMLCGYLTPVGDPGYSEIINKARQYAAPLITIPDRGPLDWRVVTRLLALCRSEKVSIWHGHDYKTNLLGLLLRRFHPMHLVTTVHGWVRHTTRTPLYYRLDRMCLPRYDRVYCVSSDLYDECRSLGIEDTRCSLIENGIDTTDYQRQTDIQSAKQALGLSTSRFLIGGVGRLSPEKGFANLIIAVSRLIQSGNDIGIILVGDGDERDRLEQLSRELRIADRVIFTGWQSNVKPCFEAMDVFALSSLREGLPNVVLEAMALGVPAVATRIAGVPRIIRDGINGTLVNPDDCNDLTRAIHELVTNHGLRASYRNAGRETVHMRYSFSRRMTKLAQSYNELLASTSTN